MSGRWDWLTLFVYVGSFATMVAVLLWGLDWLSGRTTALALLAFLAFFVWFVTEQFKS